jgi:hypothetical protein
VFCSSSLFICVHGLQWYASPLLREIYIRYALYAAEYEQQIVETIKVLRSAGVDPILVKGWAAGRLYAEPGLRPPGDIDLYVSPDQRVNAQIALDKAPPCFQHWVDFDHDEIDRDDDRDFRELYDHTEVVNLAGSAVRILGAEDHLRLLCLHLLKHGGWRPLWLCDVAAAVESQTPHFDWKRCLGKNEAWADRITCTVLLAKRLLGANVGDTPTRRRNKDLPAWLMKSLLKQWNAPYPTNLPLFTVQVRNIGWKAAIGSVARRWPNPVQATIDTNARFDRWPRLPFQLKNCVDRSMKLYRGRTVSKHFRPQT